MTTHTRCPVCGNPPTLTGCLTCDERRRHRALISETTRKNKEITRRQKVYRWFDDDNRAQIHQALLAQQGGRCLCCDTPNLPMLHIDWALDETTDDGCPVLRGVICRGCKIALNRLVWPSKYTLTPKQIAMLDAYLRRPWRDPRQVTLLSAWVKPDLDPRETKMAQTDSLVAWLDSLRDEGGQAV